MWVRFTVVSAWATALLPESSFSLELNRAAYELHKFFTRLGVIQERPGKCAGCCDAMLLLDPAHLHAQMSGLDYNGHATR
jgi:hypothetical protein